MQPVEEPDEGFGDEGFEEVLRSLAASARAANLARTAILEDALQALEEGSLSPSDREAAAQAAHQLVGSAGTFGRHRSSELAAGLERWFRDGAAPDGDPDLAHVRTRLAALRADLDDGAAPGSARPGLTEGPGGR
nr:Hpt domain-containing protein [uncultured Friedmanniella sp.]